MLKNFVDSYESILRKPRSSVEEGSTEGIGDHLCVARESALHVACEGPAWSAVDDHGLLTRGVLYWLR